MDVVFLEQNVIQALKIRQATIVQQELILLALKSERESFIGREANVDMCESWELDLERGILKKAGTHADQPE